MTTNEEDDVLEGCAGLPIKAAMHPFSVDFLAGCKKFAELAKQTDSEKEVMIYSTSSIVNAACYLEAKLNEEIAISRMFFNECSREGKRWGEIKESERHTSVPEKWNRISSLTGGRKWSHGEAPFQSFETITSLRNELVHYKGDLLGKDEAPSRRIEALMRQLGIKSEASWGEDECSSWVTDLLSNPDVARWVAVKITSFDRQYYDLMHRKP
ncbi:MULTISPECIES: hypothetical protein [unclassified Methylophaga]|jgi:hypothetical protein|uniref:hypothetical protein n=1 Tax=unclassified Methylophaga TaxID=2629249 RepID=UPI000C8F4A90|nr:MULTISPECIES: hypothetical protein [unclassified Methylophaga]MAK66771.1 hypothetical protein [Methylophaga sp.]MAY17661.1 hypothetical protein [Methylophaga sp.]HAO24271.1 hypothetical protein [Methylophaga sp.]HCD06423.1 hypothetical protein [Methylophaga sp.]|tara:strand:- start:25867 stop:26502 length:636 start_codon:yes stop_codon:yes gene_type:complete